MLTRTAFTTSRLLEFCSRPEKGQAAQQQRAYRDLVPINKTSRPGRFYAKLVRDVEADLAPGRTRLSRIESELVRAFAGCATGLQYLNAQIALGEFAGELDFGAYATLASTMLRSALNLDGGGDAAANGARVDDGARTAEDEDGTRAVVLGGDRSGAGVGYRAARFVQFDLRGFVTVLPFRPVAQ